jgi:thermitase
MLRHRSSSWSHLLVPALAIGLVFAFVTAASGRTLKDESASTAAADSVNGAGSATSAASADPTARVLVEFKSSTPSGQQSNAVSAVGAKELSVIPDLDVHVLSVPASRAQAALTGLKANPAVRYAEPDEVLKPQEQLPNDPYFLNSGAWNLGGGAWGWYVTHTTQAWDITEGDPSVVIAVLDTGIKTNGLSDFSGQISSTWNVLKNTSDATTNAGNHGTYVAGVAALSMGNGVGNAGYCPKCRLMVVQVGTDSGANLSDLANGLTYAADHGARVANMSWAGATDSATLQSAINYAHNKGLVITAAAGNSNCNCVNYPAADQNVLGVAGVSDAAGDKQGDSNYGSWVKVAAPEGNLTAWPSINGSPGYAAVGGTSVAAPAAAGIAALLFSYDASLTNTQVEQALELSAAPVKFTVAFGRVDALAALQYLGAADPQPASPPVQTAAPQLYYELNGWTSLAPLTGAPQVGQVLVRGIGGWTGSTGLAVSNLQWQRCDAAGGTCVYLTNQSSYTVQSADSGSTIKLAFSVGNLVGSVPAAVLSPVVGGTTTTTTSAPANTSPPAISGTPQAGQTLAGTTGSWSGSPTSYAYQWQDCDSGGANCTDINAAVASSYIAQGADVGHTLRLVVTAVNSAGSTTATSAATAVVIAAPSTTPTPTTQMTTFSGSLNPQYPSRSFTVTVGAGSAHAALSFSKCKALALGLSNGVSNSGPSVLTLDGTLAAGTYTYSVSGGKCSFALTVTAPSP